MVSESELSEKINNEFCCDSRVSCRKKSIEEEKGGSACFVTTGDSIVKTRLQQHSAFSKVEILAYFKSYNLGSYSFHLHFFCP